MFILRLLTALGVTDFLKWNFLLGCRWYISSHEEQKCSESQSEQETTADSPPQRLQVTEVNKGDPLGAIAEGVT